MAIPPAGAGAELIAVGISNAPRRPQASAARPIATVSAPPIAIATGVPSADATRPIVSPPIGTEAEKTVV